MSSIRVGFTLLIQFLDPNPEICSGFRVPNSYKVPRTLCISGIAADRACCVCGGGSNYQCGGYRLHGQMGCSKNVVSGVGLFWRASTTLATLIAVESAQGLGNKHLRLSEVEAVVLYGLLRVRILMYWG